LAVSQWRRLSEKTTHCIPYYEILAFYCATRRPRRRWSRFNKLRRFPFYVGGVFLNALQSDLHWFGITWLLF
jgi:hypothetical protein